MQSGDVRFMVDHMVIKLGKYLRCLGFDAAWDTRQRTHELIERANAEGRVFLTRNRHLEHAYPNVRRSIVPTTSDPVEQLREVIATLHLDTGTRLFSRCIRCNVPLEEVADSAEVRQQVHPNVYKNYSRFYRCPRCRTVFWKGTHVRNTCRKLGLEPGELGSDTRAT